MEQLPERLHRKAETVAPYLKNMAQQFLIKSAVLVSVKTLDIPVGTWEG